MVDTDDTCASAHTIRCTLARGHDGPHTAFRTRVSWTGDVDATARLRELIAEWRSKAQDRLAHRDVLPMHVHSRARLEATAHAYRACADELESALSPLRSTPQEGTTDEELCASPSPVTEGPTGSSRPASGKA